MTDIKRMDIKEFRAEGFLQEVNRLFFHPRGLALEILIDDENGEERLGGIWDYRDDPEGVVFGPDCIDQNKVRRVETEYQKHCMARNDLLGSEIQQE